MSNKVSKIDTKNLSANNHILIVIVVVTLVVAVCGFIMYSLIGSIVLNTKLISHKSEAKKKLQQNVTNADALVVEYNALGQKKGVIEDALPTDPDFPQLVAVAENMANASGVKLVSASQALAVDTSSPTSAGAPASGATAPKPFRFIIDVNGNYAGMAKLAHALELSARPMRVVEATFKGDTGALKTEFTIETYYQDKADISTKTGTVK